MKIAISHWPLAIGKKNGFTVLELVIAIVLLSIVSLIIATIVIRSGIFFEKQQGSVEVGLSNRFVLDEIVDKVRVANQIESNFTGNGQNYTTGVTSLILRLAAIDNDGEAISGVFDRVVFYLDGTKIIEKVYPDTTSSRKKTDQILTADVKELNFAYNDSDVTKATAVTVNLTTVKKLPSGDQENSDKIKAVLRNFSP